MKNPIATLKIKKGKTIKMELYPSEAPESVKNFISLSKRKFFDGLYFWRVENGKLIQSGCPDNDGAGALEYCIKSECKNNGVNNNLRFTRGTVGLGRFEYNTENSDFYIVLVDTPKLDDEYVAFAKVIEGMDEADRIGNVETVEDGFLHRAVEKVYIESITVETFGVEYGEPEKLKGFTKAEIVAKMEAVMEERKRTGFKVI
ncbi:peptidylprolyl isomerase [Hathewaya massiliensis]|uniref:peptidylprolyl isomerase n=1 Tax=Hathewaya massiliensis TaxID=1964382 RepID=UPI0011589787|nr:peptidylprolyl isomerase [Hathewaya massiliensis]